MPCLLTCPPAPLPRLPTCPLAPSAHPPLCCSGVLTVYIEKAEGLSSRMHDAGFTRNM